MQALMENNKVRLVALFALFALVAFRINPRFSRLTGRAPSTAPSHYLFHPTGTRLTSSVAWRQSGNRPPGPKRA